MISFGEKYTNSNGVTFDSMRNYVHYLVRFDESIKIESISRPFTFEAKSVEFCIGMYIDRLESTVNIFYTVFDT